MARSLQLFTAHQADYFQGAAFPDKTPTTGHFIASFPDTGDPLCAWGGRMPPSYNNGNLQVVIHWASTTVTSGGCVWNVAFERLDEDGQALTTGGFAADVGITSNPSSTLAALSYATIAFSNAQADSVQATESFRIRVTRNTTSGSDTMVGDADILNVEVIEA